MIVKLSVGLYFRCFVSITDLQYPTFVLSDKFTRDIFFTGETPPEPTRLETPQTESPTVPTTAILTADTEEAEDEEVDDEAKDEDSKRNDPDYIGIRK